MDALNPNVFGDALGQIQCEGALPHQGVIKLGNLIPRGQIRIKVIFAIKLGFQMNLGIQGQAGFDGLLNTKPIQNGQHPGHTRIQKRHVGVGIAAKGRRGTGKQFGLRYDLRMDLHPNNNLVGTGGRGNGVGHAAPKT